MSKRILSILLAISIVACIFSGLQVSVSAETEGVFKYSVYNNEATIYGNNGASGDVTIPSTLGGYPVTTIQWDAFYYCTSLKSITIPKSVTSIGNSAFRGCSGLTSVKLPDSVTNIGFEVFSRCTGLKSITIPNSVTSIDSYAFADCTGLKSITIPNSVTIIDSNAFNRCTGLTSATIGKGVTSIGYEAFRGCTGLTSVTIGNSVTSIGYAAFSSCERLMTVYYTGTKSQKSKINIQEENEHLTNATWKYAAKISVSASKYTYNGKTKTPTVTVKDAAGKKLTKNKDYTVSYAKGRKYVGKYGVKITLKNNYYNNSPTRYFTINPKGTTVSKLTTPKTKQIKVTWGKQATQTTGYQIQYSTSKTFKSGNKTATVTSSKTTSKTLTGLTKGKTYYVRVRTYKTVKGTKYYSAWSTAKSIKTK